MTVGIILAGGLGTRFEGQEPKQFALIKGHPMLAYTIAAFNKHDEIDRILIVCHEDWTKEIKDLVSRYSFNKVKDYCKQGKTRRESSFNAISHLASTCQDDDIVLIHDGARPNVSKEIISENIDCARKDGACQTVTGVQDTMVLSNEGGTSLMDLLDRDRVFAVQTPQTFKYSIIKEGHLKCPRNIEVTDDAGLVHLMGGFVSFVYGDKLNIKLTTKEDLKILESLIKEIPG